MIATRRPGAIGRLTPFSGRMQLISLVLLVWGITTEVRLGLGGRHLAALLLLMFAVAGWLGWAKERVGKVTRLTVVSLAVMALAGGALAAFASLAMVFVGVAAFGAATAWTLAGALWLAPAGPLAMLVSVSADGDALGMVVGGVAAALAGTASGISRRQSLERTADASAVQVSEARADAERARAELLAGRNHLARELHDVLAHTLSALSVQLEALDALLGAGPATTVEVRDQLERSKHLVRDGLDEARGAVQALRQDAPPIEEQLARLVRQRQAAMHISGLARPLAPDVSLAVYRVAQEALTNVVKHAPGADAVVELAFDQHRVTLSVSNCCTQSDGSPSDGSPSDGSPLTGSGAGYGLQGIRERVLLLGGRVDAGPTTEGWLVHAEVPG